MANEASPRVRIGNPIDMTVGNTSGIEKGAILHMEDALTASGATVARNPVVAGIAAREKVASDGRTRLAVWRSSVFDCKASGAITVGDGVVMAGHDNYVMACPNSNVISGANLLGTALETATDEEIIQVEVNPITVKHN
jgi:hypothetical protein